MAKQVINIGTAENDNTGDHNRVAWDKTNQNFTELYTADTTFLTTTLAAATYAPIASPSFTGDPQAPTPAISDNDTSIATTAFVKAAIAAAGQVFYCDLTDAADVATYKRMLLTPSAHAESSASVVCTGTTTDFLIASFITDLGVPGAIDFPAGSAYRRLYGSVSGGAARFRMQVYVRTTGGVETLARDETSNNFSDTVATLQEWLATPAASGTLAATDRLVVKVSARRISGPTNVTVTLYSEGSAHASQIQTTIALNASTVLSATPPLVLSGGNLTIDLSGYQPLDADLTAIAALVGTNVIYYRSAANTWAAVNVSTGLSFSGGNLTATGGGGDVFKASANTFTAQNCFTNFGVVIGHTATILGWGLEAHSAGGAPPGVFSASVVLTYWGNDAGGSILKFQKSKSGAIGTHTAVGSGDNLGYIQFFGSDGAAFVNRAEITVSCASATTANFNFKTHNGTALAERMRLFASGGLAINSALTDPGAGGFAGNILGITSAAPAGYVGEYLEYTASPSSALAAGTYTTCMTQSIPAGDWDIQGIVRVSGTAGAYMYVTIHTTVGSSGTPLNTQTGILTGLADCWTYTPPVRVLLTTATNYQINVYMQSAGTLVQVIMTARRRH